MYTQNSALLSIDINRIITDKSATLGTLFKPSFSKYVQKLFANNEQGFFYDPNDLSTMYQDAAGTTPVTGVGQPVGMIRDKSGRNNHAFQTNSASRPILRKNAVTGANYLEFDGSDDFFVTGNIDFTATDKVSLFAGVTNFKDQAACIAELSNSIATNPMVFHLFSGTDAGRVGYFSYSTGSAAASANFMVRAFTYLAPNSAVLSAKHDISDDLSILRVNSAAHGGVTADKGSGNFGTYPLYIGRRGGTTQPFNGHIYSLIGVGKLASEDETTAIEKELAERVGVSLNV